MWAPPALTVHVEATELGVLVILTPNPTFKTCLVHTNIRIISDHLADRDGHYSREQIPGHSGAAVWTGPLELRGLKPWFLMDARGGS